MTETERGVIESSLDSTRSTSLRRLVETGIALSSELSLEALLRSLIETAVELTGARYGALGVIDRLGTGLEQFITVGVDAETQATIGELAARPRDPRRADPRARAAPAPRARPGSPLGRLPAGSSADELVPRRPDHAARRRLRQPLPDREGGRRGVHRGRRGDRCACSPRRRRSRSRTRACTSPRGTGRASSSR